MKLLTFITFITCSTTLSLLHSDISNFEDNYSFDVKNVMTRPFNISHGKLNAIYEMKLYLIFRSNESECHLM